MKFSENWLRQHVPTTATHDELVATLTAIGLEVEEVTALGELLDGVVVAQILSAEKHPEADRLQVCQVDAGNGEIVARRFDLHMFAQPAFRKFHANCLRNRTSFSKKLRRSSTP